MMIDHAAVYDLFAEYGALIDMAKFDEWLDLFAEECRYRIIPRENFDRGLPAALVFCDSRAVLEDRLRALREANKYNIHTDRHVIGLPRILDDGLVAEAPFAVYQTDQEGETGSSRPASIATGWHLGEPPQDPRQADPARYLCHPNSARDALVTQSLHRESRAKNASAFRQKYTCDRKSAEGARRFSALRCCDL